MVIGTDTDRSTIYDFLFVVCSNNGFLRKKTTAIWSKIAIFPISLYIGLTLAQSTTKFSDYTGLDLLCSTVFFIFSLFFYFFLFWVVR